LSHRKECCADGSVGCAGLQGWRQRLGLCNVNCCGLFEDFHFFKANDALVGNLPAEILGLAMLLVVLLEEDGAARITNERAGSRKADIPGAILDFDRAAKKSRVTCHILSFLRGSPRVNSTKGLMRRILWKLFHDGTKNSIRGKNLGFFQTCFDYRRKKLPA